MNKVKCNLKTDWHRKELFYPQLLQLRREYIKEIKENNFITPKNLDTIGLIKHLKRDLFKIGPWENITTFEAANRIASDLVLLKGLEELIENDFKARFNIRVKVFLGNSHDKTNPGDFIIYDGNNVWRGEAFNVAPSFYKEKLRKTRRAWENRPNKKNDKFRYILINNDVVKLEDCKSLDKEGINLIGVEGWCDIQINI